MRDFRMKERVYSSLPRKDEYIGYYRTWRNDPSYQNEAAEIKEMIKMCWHMTDEEIDAAADKLDENK